MPISVTLDKKALKKCTFQAVERPYGMNLCVLSMFKDIARIITFQVMKTISRHAFELGGCYDVAFSKFRTGRSAS